MSRDIEHTLRLALAIYEFDPAATMEESRRTGEHPECVCCGGVYVIEMGDDPTPTCHACAHELLSVFVEALLKKVAITLAGNPAQKEQP